MKNRVTTVREARHYCLHWQKKWKCGRKPMAVLTRHGNDGTSTYQQTFIITGCWGDSCFIGKFYGEIQMIYNLAIKICSSLKYHQSPTSSNQRIIFVKPIIQMVHADDAVHLQSTTRYTVFDFVSWKLSNYQLV